MAYPTWPDLPDVPLVDSWQEEQMYLDPIVTDMEGGNKRMRTRPGDGISRYTFRLLFTTAQYATFKTFVITTLGRGTSRWTMRVWNGTAMETKTVQFSTTPKPTTMWPKMMVAFDLWIYP